jgi:hypothetical protein
MSTISAGTTSTTALVSTGDTTGNLILATGATPTTALTLSSTTQGATFANTVNALNTFGFENRLINGNMVIDQRNGGASVTPTTNGTYTLDRWRAGLSQSSKYSVQQNAGSVTPPAGFTKYLGATSLSAYSVTSTDIFTIAQYIEGQNMSDLAWGTASAKTVTLSFRVYSSLTGTFGGCISNSAVTRSYPFTYSVPVANTWTTISVTIAGDTSGTWLTTNGIGMGVYFSLGTGTTYSGTAGAWAGAEYYSATGAVSVVGTSGATFYITGVQFEVGSQATSFDFRSYGTELNLCQRYYQAFVQGGGYFHLGSAISTSQVRGPRFTFFQTMRTTPTITLPTAGSGAGQMYYCVNSGAAASIGNFTAQQIKQDSFFLEGETWSGVSLGGASLLAAGTGGVTIAISAEL